MTARATNVRPIRSRPRILFFGMPAMYSAVHLTALLDAGERVVAIVAPGKANGDHDVHAPLELVQRCNALSTDQELPDVPNIFTLAEGQGIPAYKLNEPTSPEACALLRAYQPELAIAAGFSRKIPSSLLAIPRGGFLNLHPSLLPAYRGPTPLFWALRAGESETGATLHFMDEEFDTGDIISRTVVPLVQGASGQEHTRRLAEAGAALALTAVATWRDKGLLPSRRQPAGGSYQSFPKSTDFVVNTDWSARRAFNFIRGTSGWKQPYTIQVGKMLRLFATEALHYEPERILGAPYLRERQQALIQFCPGVLHVRLWDGQG